MLIEVHVVDYDTSGPCGVQPLWLNPQNVSTVTGRQKYERDSGKTGSCIYLIGDSDPLYLVESVEEVVEKINDFLPDGGKHDRS